MNHNQKVTVIAVICFIVLTFLFPPHALFAQGGTHYMGWSFIASVPEHHSIHIAMLFAEWVGVLIIGGLIFWMLKGKGQSHDNPSINFFYLVIKKAQVN